MLNMVIIWRNYPRRLRYRCHICLILWIYSRFLQIAVSLGPSLSRSTKVLRLCRDSGLRWSDLSSSTASNDPAHTRRSRPFHDSCSILCLSQRWTTSTGNWIPRWAYKSSKWLRTDSVKDSSFLIDLTCIGADIYRIDLGVCESSHAHPNDVVMASFDTCQVMRSSHITNICPLSFQCSWNIFGTLYINTRYDWRRTWWTWTTLSSI